MATLDLTGALQSMINSTTPEALMQRNMGLAMFSGKVSDVAARSRTAYLETCAQVSTLVEDSKMTEEQAALVRKSAQRSMDVTGEFEAGYFS